MESLNGEYEKWLQKFFGPQCEAGNVLYKQAFFEATQYAFCRAAEANKTEDHREFGRLVHLVNSEVYRMGKELEIERQRLRDEGSDRKQAESRR